MEGASLASRETIESRTRELLQRLGLGDVQPGVALAAMALCAIAVAWAAWRWWPQGAAGAAGGGLSVTAEPSMAATAPAGIEPSTAPVPAGSMVHVAGAVRHPGVYELGPGARVVDAVEAAGGALADARLASVNLARPVTDGEQILVPDEDDAPPPPAVASGRGASSPGAGGAGVPGGAVPGGQVDLNTADQAMLDTLPGVGPSTAAKIIADREANGPFASAEDLRRVSGIGEKKFEALKDLVCVR